MLNVLDKLPTQLPLGLRLLGQIGKDLRSAATARTRSASQQRLEETAADLRQAGQEAVAETVLRDLGDLLTFYDFPQEHGLHLRTTNPIESISAGVRARRHVGRAPVSPSACRTWTRLHRSRMPSIWFSRSWVGDRSIGGR